MKIRPEHREVLVSAVRKVMMSAPSIDEYSAQGLSAKRWRWDLFWAAQRRGILPDRFVCDSIYPYANDDHIDTVLRYAVRSERQAERGAREAASR